MDEFITTTGSGAVSAEPDAMRVGVAVETSASTVAEALDAVATAARRAGEAARRHTEPSRISSRGFRVHTAHDHRGRPDGYLASHSLIALCDLASAGPLVSDLGEAIGDMLRVHDVEPVVTDTRDLLTRARQAAFADAHTKAAHLAELAGRGLDRVLRANEGGVSDDSTFTMQASFERSGPVEFEAGKEQVTATVTVSWAFTD
jgi:uncharacterized protein